MGREWYRGGKSSKRAGAGGEKDTSVSGCMSVVFQFFDFHQFQFALHQQEPSVEPTSIFPEEPTIPKGTEAPRNSLQSEELPLPHVTRESADDDNGGVKRLFSNKNLKIQMGIQIKTRAQTGPKAGAPDDFSSEISGSPGAKTPNLVARLMGLDLFPETQSPRSSSSTHGISNPLSKSHLHPLGPQRHLHSRPRRSLDNDLTGTQSLPETPRISSARRSDVDHRLSLQINKENLSAVEDVELSRFSYVRRKEIRIEDEHDRSPSQYARQILKQVKEKVSRKVGLDISNTITNRYQGRPELVGQVKSRKHSKAFSKVVEEASPGKYSTSSCSPRDRFLEPKTKATGKSPSSKDRASQLLKTSSSSLPFPLNDQPQPTKVSGKPKIHAPQKQQVRCPKPTQQSKIMASEMFSQRLKKPPQTTDIVRNKQEEPFVRPSKATRVNTPDKKCKKTPLSNDLLNITVPTLLPVKKDPSPAATGVPQKLSQVFDDQKSRFSSQLSCSSSQTYKQEATRTLIAQESKNGAFTNGGIAEEYQYVADILSRTGIQKDTLVSFTNWFSPSHPLDPAIFEQLDHPCLTAASTSSETLSGLLDQECSKRLLFHLVDELLVEILKPYTNVTPWASSNRHAYYHMQGSQLMDTLFAKFRSFPRADCHVLEDIDALIDRDLPKQRLQSAMALEEEGEVIVTEIEKDIMEALVHETALAFW